ncbi:MAG: universal stress protein, partial [Burkholderiaceae bacterium]|nr:universal stress protein [Burkholderiaceae bacterium]
MSESTRPDPDKLLAQLRADESRAARGKLRIYFGASAGVGKTWAMLSGAQREREAGRDVAAGVIETHGRTETAALLAGLEQLPPRQVAYRGRTLAEFDLDAALTRHPALLLVDELAHSNASGSRHAKRWQDVQELLDAGIDVWTTLNVQHLESLNGTVGAITGVRVHETVPDAVLDGAQEVLLIDVTPDELLRRLNAGKVYLPRQAERALQNFFRKGNLIALREIALRRTAEHVEGDVRDWRVEQSTGTGSSAPPVWNTSGAILAAVDAHEDAAQTVRRAARLAGQLNVAWYTVHVETPRLGRQSATQHQRRTERVLAVLKLAEELGAQTAVLSGSNVARTLAAEAQRLNCAIVVLGRPNTGPFWRRAGLGLSVQSGVARALARCAPALDVVSVGEAPSARYLPLPRAAAPGSALATSGWQGYVWALGAS